LILGCNATNLTYLIKPPISLPTHTLWALSFSVSYKNCFVSTHYSSLPEIDEIWGRYFLRLSPFRKNMNDNLYIMTSFSGNVQHEGLIWTTSTPSTSPRSSFSRGSARPAAQTTRRPRAWPRPSRWRLHQHGSLYCTKVFCATFL